MNRLKWDKAYALEQAGDDAELVEELLDIFRDSLRTDLEQIARGLAEGSPSLVCRAAHSIKGGAASLGIGAIAELASDLEQQSHAGSLELARDKLPLLEDMLAELQKI
jgi:HPt (histidine-containing phosphotransfer) domain-containing protein